MPNKTTPKKAKQIMAILTQKYSHAKCELTYNSPFQLLISVILSAQCTDKQVNRVTPNLFKYYANAFKLANADINHVKELINSIGFFNTKAKNIINCARVLVEKYNGQVPESIEKLVELPGVGRKTANVVLGVVFNQRAWTVDTHLNRLSNRLGFTDKSDPYDIEMDLIKLFKNDDWSFYSIVLIFHGRQICKAISPLCTICPVKDLCPSFENLAKKVKKSKTTSKIK